MKSLQIVEDFQSTLLFSYSDCSKNIYCFGSCIKDKYFFANESQYIAISRAAELLDGTRTLEEIQEILMSESIKVDIERICDILVQSELVVGATECEAKGKEEFNEIKTLIIPIKSFSLKRMEPLFSKVSKFSRLVFWAEIALSLPILISCFLQGNVNLPWTSVLGNPMFLLFYIIFSTISILLHEFSHAFMGSHVGLNPSSLTIAAYAYVSPLIYIKLPGLYFKKETDRLFVWSAGIATNLLLFSTSLLLTFFTSGMLNLILATIAYTNLTIMIYSLNPLFYSDGYYLLSTILKKPNLRKSALKNLIAVFRCEFKRENIVYLVYCIIVMCLLVIFAIPQLYIVLQEMIRLIQTQAAFIEYLKSFSNVIIIVFVAIVAKKIATKKQKHI